MDKMREALSDKIGCIVGQSVDPAKVHDACLAVFDALAQNQAAGEPECIRGNTGESVSARNNQSTPAAPDSSEVEELARVIYREVSPFVVSDAAAYQAARAALRWFRSRPVAPPAEVVERSYNIGLECDRCNVTRVVETVMTAINEGWKSRQVDSLTAAWLCPDCAKGTTK